MRLRTSLISTAALLLLAACGHGDKFPYPPQYVSVEQVPPSVLPAPPAKGTDAFNKALNKVIAHQRNLSPHEIEIVKQEDHIQPTMIVYPVIGSTITPDAYPALYENLKHAASDAWRISDNIEDYYGSPRPWYTDKQRVKLYVNQITRPGYPSGHTTTNTTWAYVLGDLLPCKQPALLARANAIGYHRMEAGAHFPFDVEGGTQLAAIIYGKMTGSPDYVAEHEAARQELAASNDPAAHCPAK